MKLIKGTKADFHFAKDLLRTIKKEPAEIFEAGFKRNELIRFDLITGQAEKIGIFTTILFEDEFINYLAFTININDIAIFEAVLQNIRVLQKQNPAAEFCLNFPLNNKTVIDYFQNKGILKIDASGYEMSISIADGRQYCASKRLKFHSFDHDKIDDYIEIENKAFAKLMKGKESISEPAKHGYANYLKARNEEKQFGAYEFEGDIVGIIIMGNEYTIRTLAVHPRFQGKGFGKLIVSDWLHRYSQNYPDLIEVKLHVDINNKSAFNFYERIGFKVTGSFSENTLLEHN